MIRRPLGLPPPPTPARRLLSITVARRRSGAPAPGAAQLRLLARYVAGEVRLRDILPALEVPA